MTNNCFYDLDKISKHNLYIQRIEKIIQHFILLRDITRLANQLKTVAKWVMNRPYQSAFIESLQEYFNI